MTNTDRQLLHSGMVAIILVNIIGVGTNPILAAIYGAITGFVVFYLF